jgi:hypothetical protein
MAYRVKAGGTTAPPRCDCLDKAENTFRRNRKRINLDTKRRQCIRYGIRDCRGGADRTALAHATETANIVRQIRLDMNDADRRNVGGNWHEIVSETGRNALALIVVDHLFKQCGPNALRDRACT